MKKLLFVLLLTLPGCALFQKEHVPPKPELPIEVRTTEYIVKVPPRELLTIPPEVPDINVDTAKQSDVAKWISLNEERMNKLESMIKGIAKFFSDEKKKLETK